MKRLFAAALCAAIPMSSYAVGSGGYTSQAVATKANGMGLAFTAVADDATAIFYNPAGLTQLEKPEVSGGLTAYFPAVSYTDTSGNKTDMPDFLPLIPYLYGAMPMGDKMALGLGLFSNFGLETHWPTQGPFKYVATDSRLTFLALNPTVAYEASDKVSMGLGLVYAKTSARLSSQLNVSALNTGLGFPSLEADGSKTIEGDGDGWGFNAGLLVKPNEKHSFGVSYRSEITSTMEGDLRMSNLAGASALVFGGSSYKVDAETEVTFPQTITVGYAYKPGKWTFALDAEYAGYSAVKETKFDITGESDPTRLAAINSITGNPVRRDWDSTWNFGAGANYVFNEKWEARGGVYRYASSIPEETWDPSITEASRVGVTLGGSWHLTSSLTFEAAYSYLMFDDREVNNTVGNPIASVDGTYEGNPNILTIGMRYRFGA